VCATRTFVLNSPLWGLWSPQGDRPVRFAAARRRARGSACKTRRGKFPPTPPIARAKPAAAAIPAQNVISRSIGIHPVKPSLKAAGVSGAPPTAAHPSDAHAAQVCFVLGSPRHLAMQRARDSAEVVSRFMRHLSRRATLCLSALHSLRQAVETVGHYAQGLSGLADLPTARSASASPGLSQGARYGSSRHRRLSVRHPPVRPSQKWVDFNSRFIMIYHRL